MPTMFYSKWRSLRKLRYLSKRRKRNSKSSKKKNIVLNSLIEFGAKVRRVPEK